MRVVVVGIVVAALTVTGIARAWSIDGAATVTEPAVRLGVVTTVAPSPGECLPNALVDDINAWRVDNGQPAAPIGDPAGSCSHSAVMAQAQSTYHSGQCYEVVGSSSDGYQLSDAAETVARFLFDDVDLTPGRERWARSLADRRGLELTADLELRLNVGESLEPADIADFISVVNGLAALAFDEQDRATSYRRLVVDAIDEMFPGKVERDWRHPQDSNGLYRPDAAIESPSGHVAVFAVSSSEKAARTALSGVNFKGWRDHVPFYVPYEPRLRPSDLERLVSNIPSGSVANVVGAVEPEGDLSRHLAEFGISS